MFWVGSNGPTIEKDPTIQKLRQDVADQLWDIVKNEEGLIEDKNQLKFVSFEDALKELIDTKNSSVL